MRINSTYIPHMSIKDTLKAISYIHNAIEDYYDKKLKPLFIELPAFYNEDSQPASLMISMGSVTRNVSFDFGETYKIGVLPLFHSNWRRMMLKKIQAEPGDAIKTEGITIWRDVKIKNATSPIHDELTYVITLDDSEDPKEKVQQITKELGSVLYSIAEQLKKKYQIENIINTSWPIISSQTLQTEMPNLTTVQKEEEILKEENNFVLENPGIKTIQGVIHSYRPPQVFNLNNQNTIILKDRINFLPVHVAEVSLYAKGVVLSDQMKMFRLQDEISLPFYKDISDEKTLNQIEIKICKSKLYMALLGKGHISEVQPNAFSLEKTKIVRKDKIEFI